MLTVPPCAPAGGAVWKWRMRMLGVLPWAGGVACHMCVYLWTQLARRGGGKPQPQLLTVLFPYVLQLVVPGRSAAMGTEGVCGWRMACVFAYGGARAVGAVTAGVCAL